MHTVAVAVTSIDGYLTRHDGAGTQEWASAEDHAHFVGLLRSCDVSVMGGETFRASADPILSAVTAAVSSGQVLRRRVIWTRDPSNYANVAVDGALEFTAEPLTEVIARLSTDGHRRCAVVGGGQIYGALLAADLVDEVSLTIEPLFFGEGIRHTGTGFAMDRRFALRDMARLNDDTILLTYGRSSAR
jgi:dihydrofolate reductase